jgi:hypothetical protein
MDSGVAGRELPKFGHRVDSAHLPQLAKSYVRIEQARITQAGVQIVQKTLGNGGSTVRAL